jgi:hypothetical protein
MTKRLVFAAFGTLFAMLFGVAWAAPPPTQVAPTKFVTDITHNSVGGTKQTADDKRPEWYNRSDSSERWHATDLKSVASATGQLSNDPAGHDGTIYVVANKQGGAPNGAPRVAKASAEAHPSAN